MIEEQLIYINRVDIVQQVLLNLHVAYYKKQLAAYASDIYLVEFIESA